MEREIIMKQHESITLMIGGPAGAGIKSVEKLLVDAFRRSGFYLFSSKEYMSRVRGGTNTVQIRIGGSPVAAATWTTDIYCALDADAVIHAKDRFTKTTLVLGEESGEDKPEGWVTVPFKSDARELGGKQYISTYAAGVLLGVLGIQEETALDAVARQFAKRDPEANARVMRAGLKRGKDLAIDSPPKLPAVSAAHGKEGLYMDGTTACGFGFLAGGCNFVASYPMSPSTGVLNFMAGQSKKLRILVEQAEDEIAAFNMVQGAWYGGGKGLTTTSGGGFALMGEGISLAGMTETPAVVYLAQRPGPATGLPTRTEQGDLDLAVHSGHGDFPRIVLAPGDTDECIELGHLAFAYADRFQVPVILLSDQYLADTVQETRAIDFEKEYPETHHITTTSPSYKRYELTDDGISPRGIPGHGEGLVCCDSDEHDERGQITENYEVRDAMVAKRHRKEAMILKEALSPRISGDGKIAVIGWGSTKKVIEEALARLNDPRLFHVHFPWVHPLDQSHFEPLRTTQANIIVENNSNAQFAARLRQHGITISETVLQSNGFPFFVDQLTERLQTILKDLP